MRYTGVVKMSTLWGPRDDTGKLAVIGRVPVGLFRGTDGVEGWRTSKVLTQ